MSLLCLYVYHHIVARHRQRSHCNEYTHNNRTIAGLVISIAVRVVSKGSTLLILQGNFLFILKRPTLNFHFSLRLKGSNEAQ